jgi:parvulin-like peptidyl-prolyl isomerase
MKKIVLAATVAATLFTSALSAKTYATVNGQNITDQDINAIIQVIPGAKFDRLTKQQQKQIIEQAIEKKLLAEKALKSGIEKTPEYKKALDAMKRELALEIWMKKQFENVKVSEKEMKDFYNKNIKMFQQPATAHARHILVKSKKEADAIIKELKKAKDVKAKFIALAKSKSTGPSAANGGDLGWFDAKRMVKPFSDAAFKLKKGQFTTTPVKTQFGYHVIYLEDKKPAGNVTFEQAKPNIEQTLKVQKFQEEMKKTAKDLKAKADIKIK